MSLRFFYSWRKFIYLGLQVRFDHFKPKPIHGQTLRYSHIIIPEI